MQVQSEVKLYKYDSPKDAMKKIHKSEGLIGLYRVRSIKLRLSEQL